MVMHNNTVPAEFKLNPVATFTFKNDLGMGKKPLLLSPIAMVYITEQIVAFNLGYQII